jgi:hypothetical protein
LVVAAKPTFTPKPAQVQFEYNQWKPTVKPAHGAVNAHLPPYRPTVRPWHHPYEIATAATSTRPASTTSRTTVRPLYRPTAAWPTAAFSGGLIPAIFSQLGSLYQTTVKPVSQGHNLTNQSMVKLVIPI